MKQENEVGASVPFTFDCAGQGNALCRVRFALFMVVLGALYLMCAPFVLTQWLNKHIHRLRRGNRNRRSHGR